MTLSSGGGAWSSVVGSASSSTQDLAQASANDSLGVAAARDGIRNVKACSALQIRPPVPLEQLNNTIRVGWKRRPRGPSEPDQRSVIADRVPALEAAIRGFAERGTEVVVNPSLGTVFDSLPEAYEFYNLYSWELGFGIRYGKSRQKANGTKSMQEIACGCAGKPERENSPRCGQIARP